MENISQNTVNKQSKFEQGTIFFFVWMGISALTLGFFALIDFLPENKTEEIINISSEQSEQIEIYDENLSEEIEEIDFVQSTKPLSISFDTLDKKIDVLNPTEATIPAMDEALLSGAVRHPGSADFENIGTIFLLGHSSYLPVVRNKNFQAFNNIQDLEWGDIIRLRSEDMEYVYSVDRVFEAKASYAVVPIQYDVPKLVLVTCNSFGSKEDRYIVEATLVSKYKITG